MPLVATGHSSFLNSKFQFVILRYFNRYAIGGHRAQQLLEFQISICDPQIFQPICYWWPPGCKLLKSPGIPFLILRFFNRYASVMTTRHSSFLTALECQRCGQDCDTAAARPNPCAPCTTCRCRISLLLHGPTACSPTKCLTHELMLRRETIVRVGCDASASRTRGTNERGSAKKARSFGHLPSLR